MVCLVWRWRGEKASLIADRGKEGAAFGKQQISCAKTNVSLRSQNNSSYQWTASTQKRDAWFVPNTEAGTATSDSEGRIIAQDFNDYYQNSDACIDHEWRQILRKCANLLFFVTAFSSRVD